MKLEDNIRALITQYQKLQQRHKLHAENAYYKFQSDMWQAMADDFGIIVEDLEQALFMADDVKCKTPSKMLHNAAFRKTAPSGRMERSKANVSKDAVNRDPRLLRSAAIERD